MRFIEQHGCVHTRPKRRETTNRENVRQVGHPLAGGCHGLHPSHTSQLSADDEIPARELSISKYEPNQTKPFFNNFRLQQSCLV
jgi:hypothetical protein